MMSINLLGFPFDFMKDLNEAFGHFELDLRLNPEAEFLIPMIVQDQFETKMRKIKFLRGIETGLGIIDTQAKEKAANSLFQTSQNGIYHPHLWNI